MKVGPFDRTRDLLPLLAAWGPQAIRTDFGNFCSIDAIKAHPCLAAIATLS
jgi:hypothetical protein